MKGLKELRESKGVLKAHIARIIGTSQSNYDKIEQQVRKVEFSKLKLIREFLGLSIKEFYETLERENSYIVK